MPEGLVDMILNIITIGAVLGGVAVMFHSPIGEAIADRIRKRGQINNDSLDASPTNTEAMQEQLDALTSQILILRDELRDALPAKHSQVEKQVED